MDDSLRKAHAALDAAKEWKPPPGPVVLSPEYLRLIERVEQLPENRPGTDKGWTERVLAETKWIVENAVEIPRTRASR